ncbi:cytochrome P450 724B1-like [Phalaenopsis equestris]|uniref:cytochrome P450 724B1-like n=1 Tax=Phalaenopsis equestris TaxID=78828 RepID=UPI0009E307F2|nr:cytochrome P450 724B1-like [Phalaenopsis equestris]
MDLFQLLPYLLSFLILFPIILYWKTTNQSSKLASKLPPGSSSTFLPFVDHTLSFISPHPSSSIGNFLQQNINRYGRIFQSHLFGRPTIVSCDAEFNSYVLNNEERLFMASYPKTIPGVLGENTLLAVNGETHKHLRGLVVSLMSAIKNPDKTTFFSDIEDTALSIMRSWFDRETIVLCDETRKFTFSVIVKQILSLEPEEEEAMELLKCYKTFMRGLTSLPLNFPGTPYAKAIKARHQINDILRGRMKRRREVQLNNKLGLDFLDILLADENITEKYVLSLMLDLLLGGYETTAMLIAIMVKYLSENPSILEELKEEHIGIMKSKRGEKLGWDDYKKMEFTQCLINESLRVGNVVKFLHRKTIKSIEFKDRLIPSWHATIWFKRIRQIIEGHSLNISYSFTNREGNKSADWLAKWRVQGAIVGITPPPMLAKLINSDMAVPYVRV